MNKSERLEKVNSLSRSETKRQRKRVRSKARQAAKKLTKQYWESKNENI